MESNVQTVSDPTGKATSSLVLGIIGMVGWLVPLIGLPVTIVGLFFSVQGMKSSKKGIATTGLVLCIIGLVLTIGNAAVGAYLGATGQLPIVNKIFEYDKAEAKMNGSSSIWGRVLGNGLMAAIFALIIGVFLKKDRNKKENDGGENLNDTLTNIHEKDIYEELTNNKNNYNKNALEKIIVEKLKQRNLEEWQIHYAKNRIMNALRK